MLQTSSAPGRRLGFAAAQLIDRLAFLCCSQVRVASAGERAVKISVYTRIRAPPLLAPFATFFVRAQFAPPALQRCSFSRSAQANFPRMLSFFFFFLPGGLWTRLSLAFGLKESALFYRSESHIFANIWFPKFATILFYNSHASFVDFKSWQRQLFEVELSSGGMCSLCFFSILF